jgi:hypothetical protein
MIAMGSGDPTRIICSALIAQAFEAVRYPILPKVTQAGSRKARRAILHIRDSSLYMPRDFDISPYFSVVKPTIEEGFDYTALHWADKPKPLEEVAGTFDPFPGSIEAPPLVPETLDEAAEAYSFEKVAALRASSVAGQAVIEISPVEQMKARAMLSRRIRFFSRTSQHVH